MENEIKVGEYVRTKEGYIGKLVEYISNALNYLKIDIGREIIHCDNSRDNFIYTRYGFQLEHSPNIIDLIEVGDYVNGKEVKHIADFEGIEQPIRKVIFVDETHLIPGETAEDKDIKTIVTKEMMESISYKVERKD